MDKLSLDGLSRSRIAGHVSVASAIYAWASTPTRRFVTRNPLRLVELPPWDEKPRLRVAFAPEAAELLAALEPQDAVFYAIAMYAGLRRSEIDRLRWPNLLDGDRIGRASSSRSRRPRPAPPAARRSPIRSAACSCAHGYARAAPWRGGCSSGR